MNCLKKLIRFLALPILFLAASPTLANAHQPASMPDKLLEDFRNFQNFGSLPHEETIDTKLIRQTPSRNDFMSNRDLAVENSTGLTQVGHLGGLAYAVAREGNYAYLVTLGELAVLDVSDPTHPVRVGYAPYSKPKVNTYWVVVSHGRAYFNFDLWGVGVVDVSDPTRPVYLGVLQLPTGGGYLESKMDILGDYAYLASGNTVWIYDLSKTGLPQLVADFTVSTTHTYTEIAISGHYAYLLDLNYGNWVSRLDILDLTNPTTPQLVGTLDNLTGSALTIKGNYVYVVGWVHDQAQAYSLLQVVDASDPALPSLVNSIVAENSNITSLVAGDQALYITSPHAFPTEGLFIYSLQDPTQPVLQGSITTKDGAYDVALSADSKHAYIADYGRGMQVIDVSNPANPFIAGAYDPPSSVRSVTVAHGYAFASSGYNGIRAIDLSNLQDPKTLGFIPGSGDVQLDGNFLYAAEGAGGLRVIDVSDPTQTVEVATLSGNFTRLVAHDGYLYAWQNSNEPLSVIDIRNPTRPIKVGSFQTPGDYWIRNIAFTGNKAYIGVLGFGCQIVDISNPGRPRLQGYCSGENTLDVAISGHYAYLLTGDFYIGYVMRILDISDPLTPVQIGEYPLGTASSLRISGDLIFLYGDFVPESVILDVSDPQAPHQVGSFGNGPFYAVASEGDTVYLGGDGGFYVMKLSSTISGLVTDASQYPVSGALVLAGSGITSTTRLDGSYAIKDLLSGSYTITPVMSGYTFVPPSRSVNLPGNIASQDFTLLPEPVSITTSPGITATLVYTGYQGDATIFEIPPGALSQTAQVVVTPTVGSGLPALAFTGHAFDLSAQDSQGPILDIGVPISLTITYTDFDIRFVTEESHLGLYRWDGNNWVDAAANCSPASAYTRDLTANQISLPICQPGRYALYGPTHAVLLPAILMNFH